MNDATMTLQGALVRASDEMQSGAAQTARAQTSLGGARLDGAMAGAAKGAIFTEALLAAVHARLAELKVVARG